MVFPTDPLLVKAEIALGADITGDPSLWSWTDISAYVRTADGSKVTVRRGRRNDSGSVSPATASFELENSDGRFCTQNPTGPYYPLLQVNTPVKISVSADSGSSWSPRFSGYLSKLPVGWRGAAASDSWVSVTAESVLRRLAQEPARSPLSWTAPHMPASNCIEYWPLEDGKTASTASSYFPDGIPMTAAGSIEFGASSPPPGSSATPQSDYAFMKSNPPSLSGIVRPYTDTGAWSILGMFKTDAESIIDQVLLDCDINHGEGSADPDQIRLLLKADRLVVEAYREDGTLLGSVSTGALTVAPPGDGEWHAFGLRVQESGADVAIGLRYEGQIYALTLTGKSLGTVRKASFPSTSITTAGKLLAVGHLAVYDSFLSLTVIDRYIAAMNAHLTAAGETTVERLSRVQDESDVVFSIGTTTADASMHENMGDQGDSNALAIIQDVIDTDGAILYEPRDFASGTLRYRARASLNASAVGTPALTLSQADFSVLEQGDDDYFLTTRVTASGAGSSVTATLDTVENETSVSANVRYPDRLPDLAGWSLFQGTRRDYRYPRIVMLLHGTPGKVTAWRITELGDRILINDPPPGVVDDISLLLEGYQESMDQYTWTVDLYCSPASRYRIAKLDDTTFGRMDTAGSRLVNAVTSSATGLDVETVEGAEWTTTAGFDIGIDGERMTASAIASAFTDSFSRTVASGWGTSDSGHAWSLTGGAAADYSTTGTRGLISIGAVNSLRSTYVSALSVAAIDRTVTVRIPVLATGAGIQYRMAARWNVAANTYYAAVLQVETTQAVTLLLYRVVAGAATTLRSKTLPLTHTATTDFRVRFKVQGSWLYAKVWNASGTEPAQWSDSVWDTAITAAGSWGNRCALLAGNTNTLPVVPQFDADATLHPQRFTVTRSVDGVVKSHAAGASVGLYQPNHLGL